MIPYSILLIDDDRDYCRQVLNAAKPYRLMVVFFHNLEDGLNALIESRRFKAIILDDRCILKTNQSGAAKSNFVIHAIQQLKDIEHKNKRSIPFCVNCEKLDEFREDLEGISRLFVKKQDHDQMFQWLRKSMDELPETSIRKEFYGIFEKTSDIFNEDRQESLVELLQNRGVTDSNTNIDSMRTLRLLLEVLMDSVCFQKIGKHPDEVLTKGRDESRTRQIITAMTPRILPAELHTQAHELYRICSKHGNHPSSSANRYRPSALTITRLIYTLLELIDFLIPGKISSSSQTSSPQNPTLLQ